MHRRQSSSLSFLLRLGLAGMVMCLLAGASTASAQFGLPKLPKLPKKSDKKPPVGKETKASEEATPEIGASQVGSMEITQISPDSAPPGGYGQVVITGKGLDRLSFELNCVGGSIKPESLKVENPNRLVAQIRVPLDLEEGPCGTGMARSTGTGEPFRISKSANMPIVLPLMYLGEGDMDYMQLMPKMAQGMMEASKGNWQAGEATPAQTKSGLEVSGSSLKFIDAGKVAFEEPVSGVKSLGEMTQMNQPTGIFRIVFNDGKIYNFADMSSSGSKGRIFLYLKKRLGK